MSTDTFFPGTEQVVNAIFEDCDTFATFFEEPSTFSAQFVDEAVYPVDLSDAEVVIRMEGTWDHAQMINRNKADQHPMSAITGLEKALAEIELTPGPQGPPGRDGRDGVNGLPGEPGPAGRDGRDGRDGSDGLPGEPGPAGRDGSPGRDGVDGLPGKDGVTPHIGENGHWWIGETDTGVSAGGTSSGGSGATDMFAMSVDEDGNLYAHYEDGAAKPAFEMDENGNLYYLIEG